MTYLLFKVASPEGDLVLLHAAGVPRPLRRQVVLSTSCPVLVVLEVVGNELLPRLLDDGLRLEILI